MCECMYLESVVRVDVCKEFNNMSLFGLPPSGAFLLLMLVPDPLIAHQDLQEQY